MTIIFGLCVTLEKTKHTYCQHGGGGKMTLACFAATGPWQLVIPELTMNSSVY